MIAAIVGIQLFVLMVLVWTLVDIKGWECSYNEAIERGNVIWKTWQREKAAGYDERMAHRLEVEEYEKRLTQADESVQRHHQEVIEAYQASTARLIVKRNELKKSVEELTLRHTSYIGACSQIVRKLGTRMFKDNQDAMLTATPGWAKILRMSKGEAVILD